MEKELIQTEDKIEVIDGELFINGDKMVFESTPVYFEGVRTYGDWKAGCQPSLPNSQPTL